MPILSRKGQRSRVTGRQNPKKLPRIWRTCLLTGGGSSADCKLGLTLLDLIYCVKVWGARQLDGRPHIMSPLVADIFSCCRCFKAGTLYPFVRPVSTARLDVHVYGCLFSTRTRGPLRRAVKTGRTKGSAYRPLTYVFLLLLLLSCLFSPMYCCDYVVVVFHLWYRQGLLRQVASRLWDSRQERTQLCQLHVSSC